MIAAARQIDGSASPPGDAGDAAPSGASPLRRCLVTGETLPKTAMIRFVVRPGPGATGAGEIAPDVEGKLPGRGLWISARRDIVAAAVAKKLFARAARAPVSASADLPERVAGLLARRCLDTLGLARRAGAAVSGFEQVRVWLDRGRAGVLIEAVEAAAGGRRKLNAVARDVRVVGLLTASELGAAFGRETTMHAALAQGRLADRFGEAADRLAGFRTMTDAAPHDGGAGN